MTISAIMPVYNEASILAASLRRLLRQGFDEIIVVDGGSTDRSVDIARGFAPAVRVLTSPVPGRGRQMNLGAGEAGGDIVLFLHADLRLPDGAADLIRTVVGQGFRCGGFCKRYAQSGRILKMYQALLNTLYLRNGRGLVGSNAMFVERRLFAEVGRFPDEDFLEDVILADRLAEAGPVAVIRRPVTVSPRRYRKEGVVRQILINARIMFGYRVLKESPARLKDVYAASCRGRRPTACPSSAASAVMAHSGDPS